MGDTILQVQTENAVCLIILLLYLSFFGSGGSKYIPDRGII